MQLRLVIPRRNAARATLLLVVSSSLLIGCGSLGVGRNNNTASPVTAAPVDRDTAVALLLANTIQTLQRLSQAGAAEQAEIMSAARSAYERAAGGSAQLRYALALAIPGPESRDPEKARTLLRELSAQPEALASVERALMLIELAQLEKELGLAVDNRRLQTEAQRSDRERQAVANRRLQAELDENAKLRKQLEAALAKLEAIALMERNLSDRPTTTEGRKP
jgi:hypothetical protein